MITSVKSFTAVATLAAAIGIFSAAQTATAAVITWTGAVDNNWAVDANWNLNRKPDSGDDVIVNGGTPISAVFGTDSYAIRNLDVSGALHVNESGTLSLVRNDTSFVTGGEIRVQHTGVFEISHQGANMFVGHNGRVEIHDNAEFRNTARTGGGVFGNMTLNGLNTRLNISGTARFNNTGDVIYQRATTNITGSGKFSNRGSVAQFLQGNFGGTVNLQDRGLFENGNSALYSNTGGTLNISGESLFKNTTGATFTQTKGMTNITGDGFFDNDTNVNLNGGSLNLSGRGVMSTSLFYTQNGGSLTVESGGLFINEGGAFTANLNGGNFTVQLGGAVRNDSTGFGSGGMVNNGAAVLVEGEGVLSGSGTFIQNSGSTTIDG
jgi:hypothetical protein